MLARRSRHLFRSSSRKLSTAAAVHDDAYPHLFAPLKLNNGIVLPNRVLMGSMHTGLEGHSIPDWMQRWFLGHNDTKHDLAAMGQYFMERAEGGVGLMVTGGIAPNREGWTAPFGAKLTTQEEVVLHREVTDMVHTVESARICMQILHTGRYAYHPACVSASATRSPISPFRARALSGAGVRRTVDDFCRTAVLAQQAGYDGVEIMGSEGYLISQFLSPRTNHRTDEYGGNFENRARFPLDVIRQTRQAVGEDFIIIFRLSLLDLVEGGLRWDECVEMAKRVEQAGATILNTGIGWHEARVPTIATTVPRGAFVRPTAALKEAGVLNIPLVATNRINTPEIAERILSEGASDMVSMARPLLADPQFVSKAMQGKSDEIITCIACNQACLDHAFLGKTASCLVNPRACHETELKTHLLPHEERLRLAVVGAGPAGCAFAIAASEMGHKVTLYDQASSIGGQFNMAKRVPGKEEFHESLRYFQTKLKKLGVDIRLETRVDYQDMEDSPFDKWIVATGVNPRDPKIPGSDHPNVLSYIDVLKHNAPVGKRVAIVGAGGIGFDMAEFLLHHDGTDKMAKDLQNQDFWDEWGIDPTKRGGLTEPDHKAPQRQLFLLQRKKGKLGAGLGKTTGWIHRATLHKSRAVEMINGVRYDRIDEDGNLHISSTKEKSRVLEVDNIVVCAGQVVRNDLELFAQGTPLQDKVYTIGGAFEAGELDAKRAIDMGTRLAVKIHQEDVVPGKHKFQAPVGAEEKMYNIWRRWM